MSGPVTVLVTRRVRPGREREFEAFLERVRALAAVQAGHQGMIVVPPPGGGGDGEECGTGGEDREYAIVYRFADRGQLRPWEAAAERAELLAGSAEPAEEGPVERELTGLEGWCAPAWGRVVAPPPRWKTWLVTLVSIYVLLLAMTTAAGPLLAPLAPPLRFALVLPALTALMTWVVMPYLTKRLGHWLYT